MERANEVQSSDIKMASLTQEMEILEAKISAKDQQLLSNKEALSKAKDQLSSLQQRCNSLETQLVCVCPIIIKCLSTIKGEENLVLEKHTYNSRPAKNR